MSEKMHDVILKTEDQLGVLSKEFHLHLLNCSSSGCLVEMRSPIEVGTIGTLRLVVDGNPFSEDVQVVRCQQIEGAGSVYHVGAKFLWTASPDNGSLRRAMGSKLTGRDDGRFSAKPLM
jgi:PilZ domain